MNHFKQLFLLALLTFSVAACGQPTNRPTPQPTEYNFSGTVYAPAGEDISGAVVVVCYVVNDACDEGKTVFKEITGSGSSAPFSLTNLENVAYDLYAVIDVNNDEDYFGEGDFYGEVGSVTPPKSGLELRLAVNGNPGNPGDPGPGAQTPESYIMKGRVTDSQGKPLSGVEVFADNTLLYDSNLLGVTGADGTYRIDLSGFTATTWRGGAYLETDYLGEHFSFRLAPDNDDVFAGVDGAVHNFTWRLSGEVPGGGYYGALVYVYASDVMLENFDYSAVELNFTPDGPLVDGSAGETLSRRLDGGQVQDIPVGRYTVTARYAPAGQEPVNLLIRPRFQEAYGSSATLVFENDPLYGLMGELELASH